MFSPYIRVLKVSGSRSFRREQKFIYTWTLHNYYCPKMLEDEELPSTTFRFKMCHDCEFLGELSIVGDQCSERQCKLVVKAPKKFPNVKLHINMYVNGIKVRHMAEPLTENSYTLHALLLEYIFMNCSVNRRVSQIECEIFTVDYIKQINPSWPPPREPTLGNHFLSLLEDKKSSDVTLVVEGHEIKAHKFILASRSKVFAAMFDHDMLEAQTNRVTLTDMDAEVLEEMLRFIYTDKVPNLSRLAYELLVVSDKYELPKLKLMCLKELSAEMSIENAAHILILADLYELKDLKKQAIIFINGNKMAVADTDGWQELVNNYPRLLGELYIK